VCYLHGNPAGLGSAERRALVERRDVAVAWCVFLLVKLLTDAWRQRVSAGDRAGFRLLVTPLLRQGQLHQHPGRDQASKTCATVDTVCTIHA